MKQSHRRTLAVSRRQRGQGMTEYIIIVALVAVAAIGAYSFFGKTVRNQLAAVSTDLSGGNGATSTDAAETAAAAAATEGTNNYSLGNFSEAQQNSN